MWWGKGDGLKVGKGGWDKGRKRGWAKRGGEKGEGLRVVGEGGRVVGKGGRAKCGKGEG